MKKLILVLSLGLLLFTTNAFAGFTTEKLRITSGSDSTKYSSFSGGTHSVDINYTLPVNDGDSTQVLTTNGSGVLSWVAPAVNLTTSTTTNLTGFIKGNGSVLSADNSTYLTTEVDGSVSNEINTFTLPDANVTAGLPITFAQAGIMAITESAPDVITFTATEVDGSITNELPIAGNLIDISGNPASTIDVDLTEAESVTWGAGAQATVAHTFANSGTDVVMTYSTGALAVTGNISATNLSGSNSGDNTVATSGDAALDFFGAGVTAVTDATTCTDIEGTSLTITTGVLNVDDDFLKLGGDVATAGTYDFGTANVVLEIPNAVAPTTDATGEMAIDTNLLTQGVLQVYLTSAIANVVATTDTPGDNEVPTYDSAGGTIQWEAAGGGAGTLAATLALGADANDVDITSLNRLEGVDNAVYIDLGTDTYVDIVADGAVRITSDISVLGTTPTITIGDAGEEDSAIVFDGNAQDYHIGLDDTDDSIKIGLGSALGTTDHIISDATGTITLPLQSGARAVLGTTQADIVYNTTTKVALDGETYDIQAEFDAVTNYRFTAKVAGYYQVSASVTWLMGTTPGNYTAEIRKNNTLVIINYNQSGTTYYLTCPMSDIIYLAINDYLELWANPLNAGDNTADIVNNGTTNGTYMSIAKIR